MQKLLKFKHFRLIVLIAGLLLAGILILSAMMLFGSVNEEGTQEQETQQSQHTLSGDVVSEESLQEESDSIEGNVTIPESEAIEENVILPKLAELYEQNPDLAGWLTIPGTVVDYPVMHTPEDGEKYIYANFEGKFNAAGSLFIEDGCSMEPESDNIIIYGHNMRNGSMFGTLMDYEKEAYWKEHTIISFSTLYEEREYEVIAAFYDRVYYQHENCFKFYQFINVEDEEHFEEAMVYYRKKSLYDTGVEASYGDRLITLVTCAYHIENGRFVVVAREKIEAGANP